MCPRPRKISGYAIGSNIPRRTDRGAVDVKTDSNGAVKPHAVFGEELEHRPVPANFLAQAVVVDLQVSVHGSLDRAAIADEVVPRLVVVRLRGRRPAAFHHLMR